MIKIERVKAKEATIVRNGNKQPVVPGMVITPDELASLTAEEGTVTYSVNEQELKEATFYAPVAPPPAAPTPVKTTKTGKVIVQPAPKAAAK